MHLSAAAELVAAGAPAAVFDGLTVTGLRVSPMAKLHSWNRCGRARTSRAPLQPATVPLAAITTRRACRCMGVAQLPSAALELLPAAQTVTDAAAAATRALAALATGRRPELIDVAALRAAVRGELRDAAAALNTHAATGAARAAAWTWHDGTVAAVRAALAAAAEAFGLDEGRGVRAAAAALTIPLTDRFTAAGAPALAINSSQPQGRLLKQAAELLSTGLADDGDAPELRARVLALVDDATPQTIGQVPDTPPPAGLGARAAALAAWRAAARTQLGALVEQACTEYARHATDTTPQLLVLLGRTRPAAVDALLADAPPLASRTEATEATAYAVPAVVARAVDAEAGWQVAVAGVPLPAGAPAAEFARVVLRLLAEGMDAADAVPAAVGVVTPAARA